MSSTTNHVTLLPPLTKGAQIFATNLATSHHLIGNCRQFQVPTITRATESNEGHIIALIPHGTPASAIYTKS
ncbi:hypothetical protein D910_06214 [Dendroctonus ponderosae]